MVAIIFGIKSLSTAVLATGVPFIRDFCTLLPESLRLSQSSLSIYRERSPRNVQQKGNDLKDFKILVVMETPQKGLPASPSPPIHLAVTWKQGDHIKRGSMLIQELCCHGNQEMHKSYPSIQSAPSFRSRYGCCSRSALSSWRYSWWQTTRTKMTGCTWKHSCC